MSDEHKHGLSKVKDKVASALGKTPSPLLEIRDLVVEFDVQGKPVPAVRGANLTVYPGQTVAIVGESGSGKSTTAAAVMGLLQGTGKVASGKIVFDGQDLSKASEKDFQKIRGNGMSLFATFFHARTEEVNVDVTTTPIVAGDRDILADLFHTGRGRPRRTAGAPRAG